MISSEHDTTRPASGWTNAFESPISAVIVGASGGIGAAVAQHLITEPRVEALALCAREPSAIESGDKPRITRHRVNFDDEASIATLGESLEHAPTLVFNCAGVLHDEGGLAPERRLAEIDPAHLHTAYTTNAVGPLLLAKHLLPRMPRDAHCVFASLSARVGSISDNGLGGWYAYRMSKAAHNMALRCAAIESARRHRKLICASLHPGTVDTHLSKPFQGNVPSSKLFDAGFAAARLLDVIGGLRRDDNGGFFAYDGTPIEY